jgi:type II secretory pathway pseudopilin PulG
LIELVIVIVVLGILASIAVAGYTAIIRRANISSVERSAVSFAGVLNTLATEKAATSGTQSGIAIDKTTRDASLIAEAILAGDGPKGVAVMVMDDSNGTTPQPMVVWNGGEVCLGLVSDFPTCAAAETVPRSTLINTTAGSGSGINNTYDPSLFPEGNPNLKYLQFVKNGASVCIRLSADGSQANDVTSGGTPTGEIVTQANMSEPTPGYGWIVVKRVAKGSGFGGGNYTAGNNACNGVEGMSGW